MTFDVGSKIKNIRLNWDQGSLLKQVEVIGARAKSWPIRDGKDQARLIASSTAANTVGAGSSGRMNGSASGNATSPTKTTQRRQTATKDPHATLSLFTPRDEDEPRPKAGGPNDAHKPPQRDYHELFARQDGDESHDQRSGSPHKDHLPKSQSAKPAPRDYHDLFVGSESDASPGTKEKMRSPRKGPATPGSVAPKGGAGKNYHDIRLFDNDQQDDPGSPTKKDDVFKKPHPKKYNHFEFTDGDDAESTKKVPDPPRPKTKHQSQWDFEDFMTPEKVNSKVRSGDVRHFGLGQEEEFDNSPRKQPVPRARPDAQTSFEFEDDGTPAGNRRPPGHPRGAGKINAGEGLYQDHILGGHDSNPGPEKKSHPLSTVTNVKDRSKDFDPHFHFTDSPGNGSPAGRDQKPLDPNRARAVKMMDAQWEAADKSPTPATATTQPDFSVPKGKENYSLDGFGNKNLGIPTAGDGMGSKKGTSNRDWMFGDGGEEGGKQPKYLPARKHHYQEPQWDF